MSIEGGNLGAPGLGGNPGTGNEGNGNASLLGNGNATLTGSGGDLGWRASLPAEYQQHPSLSHYPDLPTFVKSALEQEKLIGRDRIVRPTPQDSKEVWDKYYNSLGRPATADEYGLKTPEDWPTDFAIPQENLDRFGKKFHELGISKEQGDALFKEFLDVNKGEYDGLLGKTAKTIEETTNALRNEWGTGFEQNLDIAKRAIGQFDPDKSFSAYIEQSGLGNDPQVIKFMHNVGKALLEDSGVAGERQLGFNLTQQQAVQELDSLYSNPTYAAAMTDFNHVQHKEFSEKAQRLAKIAYPG